MTPEYAEANRWIGLKFEWGVCDCILVLGNWVKHWRGADPFESDYLTYQDAGSCQRVTQFFTDPVGRMDSRLKRIGGLEKTNSPAPGDIAIVIPAGHRRPSGALWLGDAWALKSPDGAMTLKPRLVNVLAIWRVKE